MPTLQNVVLADRASPVVNHTFTPVSNEGGVAVVAESNGTKIGEPRLYLTPKPGNQNKKYQVDTKLVVPVVATEVINGVLVPKVIRNAVYTGNWSFAPDSTEQERKDLVGMVESMYGPTKTLVNDTIVKLQGIYG